MQSVIPLAMRNPKKFLNEPTFCNSVTKVEASTFFDSLFDSRVCAYNANCSGELQLQNR